MPQPPDEYFFEQVTKQKREISLLQTEVQSLRKRLELLTDQQDKITYLEKVTLRQQTEIDGLKSRNSLPWWKRFGNA